MKSAIATLFSIATARDWSNFKVNMADFAEQWFENKLDHFTEAETTYKQRFWVNDKFYDPATGPVFIYICGEWTCSPPDERSYQFMVGASHKALLVTLEHRYYGASQPFDNWETANLQYLSSEQALADLAYFIEEKNKLFKTEIGRVPKWLVIGGSYPGALSAWFKEKYPEHVVGAWSSSGVIDAIEDFSTFDESILKSTTKSGELCPQTIQAHYKFAEKAFETDEGTAKIVEIFHIDTETLDKSEFFFYLADIYVTGVQYGGRTTLCHMLMTNQEKGLDMYAQLEEVFSYGVKKGVTYDGYSHVNLRDTSINVNSAGRCWTYQYCTEFGFFQTPGAVFPLRSSAIDIDFWPSYCQKIFGDDLPTRHVDVTNQYYKGLYITGKNIYFANASEDPWQMAGMREFHTEEQERNMGRGYIDCEDCGHCVDLHTPTDGQAEALTKVQDEIADYVSMWLEEAALNDLKFMQF